MGTAMLAEPGDVLFPSHRDMAVFFDPRRPPAAGLRPVHGPHGGLTRGRDGNMHMGDMKLNIVSIISAMAATVPVAAGAALALKYKGTRNVAFCYFGDGATSRGDWHEGVNLAAVQKPARGVHLQQQRVRLFHAAREGDGLRQRGRPRAGLRHSRPRSWTATTSSRCMTPPQRALAHARAGHGPYLLECKTFRMTGHSAHDPADYVPKELFEEWAKKDPIERLERLMLERGWSDEDALAAAREAIRKEVDEAVEWAEASPYPDPSELCEDVYDEADHADHLSRSHPPRSLGRDGARPERLSDRGGHRRLRRRVQGDRRISRALRRAARGGYADLRIGHRGRGDRARA